MTNGFPNSRAVFAENPSSLAAEFAGGGWREVASGLSYQTLRVMGSHAREGGQRQVEGSTWQGGDPLLGANRPPLLSSEGDWDGGL